MELTQEERRKITELVQHGCTLRQIADAMGWSPQRVSRAKKQLRLSKQPGLPPACDDRRTIDRCLHCENLECSGGEAKGCPLWRVKKRGKAKKD